MKAKVIILILLTFFYSFSQQEKMNIAVMELDGKGVSETDLSGLSDQLRTELFQTGKYDVIERSRMNEILKEQGFQQTGCTNTECAVEIGQLIGVNKIIVGSINKVGTIYTASIRMVDVGTAKIDKIASEHCKACSIDDVLLVTIHNVARILAGLEADKVVKRQPVSPQLVQPTAQTQIKQSPNKVQKWVKLGLKNKDEWVMFKQSGMSIEKWRNIPHKSIEIAGVCSAFLPGAGFYYYGSPLGILYTLSTSTFFIIGLTGIAGSDVGEDYDPQTTSGIACLSIAGTIYLVNIIHTCGYASLYNKGELKHPPKNYPYRKVSINPSYNFGTKQTGLSLSYNF